MFTMGPPFWGGGTGGDPFAASVTSLRHFKGANGAATFTDELGLVGNALVGSPALSTAQSKWGGSSLLQSTSVVHCSSPGTGLHLPGDFTIEGWLYMPSPPLSSKNVLVYFAGANDIIVNANDTSIFLRYTSDSEFSVTPGSSFIGVWIHWFAGRSGANTLVGANGVIASNPTTNTAAAPSDAFLGGVVDGTYYIDDFRVTKGVCRYTGASYAVPTAEFPNP